jgi:hypothetical protein
MPKHMAKYLDRWSAAVIVLTVILFALSLFLHGLTHDLLLEAGILLVSAKLVIMSYKNSVQSRQLSETLDEIKNALIPPHDSPANK